MFYLAFFEQFETESKVNSELTISEDLLNTKYKDKLESSYKVIQHILLLNCVLGIL